MASRPPPADGAAHPDHRATDPATDPPSAASAARGRGAIAPLAKMAAAGRGPWPAWRSGVISWSPTVETVMNTVSTDDAYVNGHVTYVAPRVARPGGPGPGGRQRPREARGTCWSSSISEPYQVQVDIKKAAVVSAEADLKAAEAQVRGHPGPGPQPAVEAPEGDRGGRRQGRPPGRTRGGPEEQGGDPRSRRADFARADAALRPPRDLPRGIRSAP